MPFVMEKDITINLDSKEQSRQQITQIIREISGRNDPVDISELKGGITNKLLLAEQQSLRVLIRTFGKNTNTFIDREREYAIHLQLQKLGLAAPMYCKFRNGIIYGYAPGRPADYKELSSPNVYKQVAKRLAQWHSCLNPQDVQANMTHDLGDFWTVLKKWVDICPKNILSISHEELCAEYDFLRQKLGDCNVFGHCDLLSANILLCNDIESETKSQLPAVPLNVDIPKDLLKNVESDLTFIDYEYAVPCSRAFDIANHLHEWQGFACDKTLIPNVDSAVVRDWLSVYAGGVNTIGNTTIDLNSLESELKNWWGMPGFFWGVWSAIQSRSSEIDFDYEDYARNRFSEYLTWKGAIGVQLACNK